MISDRTLAEVIVDLLDGMAGADRYTRIEAVRRQLHGSRESEAVDSFARAKELGELATKTLASDTTYERKKKC